MLKPVIISLAELQRLQEEERQMEERIVQAIKDGKIVPLVFSRELH